MKRLPDGVIGTRPHQPKAIKHLPWPVCACCGLVYLKNEATRKRLSDGCYVWKDEKK